MSPASVIGPDAFDDFGALLKHLRLRAGLTQRDLALAAGYHFAHISRLEHNERLPDTATLLALFVPALGLEDAPAWALRLLQLAAQARGEPLPPQLAHIQVRSVEVTNVALAEPPPEPGPVASQTPVPLNRLLGRDADLKAVRQILLRPEVRLLTLVGPPGVGKTSLALQAAQEMAGRFKHGAVYVDLTTALDEADVSATVATALAAHDDAAGGPAAAVERALRDRHQLLLLDNFEQVRAAAPRLAGWLRAAPRVKALVTSREHLRVSGEHEFALRPLEAPPAAGEAGGSPSPERLAAYPAVQLFVERARAAQPDFALTSANAQAVAEICARLDGMPLPIELAAARIQLLPPQAMQGRLDKRLAWLTHGPSDAPAWRRTLRGAIDWSCALLDETEKQAFAALAVFAGTFAASAAEAITGASLDVLDSLAGKSLVQVLPPPDGGEARLRLLETLREYALERLQADPQRASAARRDHGAYFLALAERCAGEMHGARQAEALRTLDLEQDNVRTALAWAEAHDSLLGLQLASSLYLYWQWRGRTAEGRAWLERFLAAAPAGAPDIVRMKALRAAGVLASAGGDLDAARAYHRQALALAQAAGNQETIGNVLNSLAVTAYVAGDGQEAQRLFVEVLAMRRKTGSPQAVAQTLNNIGVLLTDQGRGEAAEPYLRESLDIRQGLEDQVNIAQSLNKLARSIAPRSRGEAGALSVESLRLRRALGVIAGMVESLIGLAEMDMADSQLAAAGAHLSEALQLCLSHPNAVLGAATLERLAWLAAAGAQAAPGDERLELLAEAVWLLSAAERHRPAQHGVPIVEDAARRQAIQAAARAALPPAQYSAAAIAGGHASWEAAAEKLMRRTLVQ